MEALIAARSKAERVIVGLMSGTSCDAIDAALVKISGSGEGIEVALLAYLEVPFGEGFDRFRLFSKFVTVDEICVGNVVLGEMFASAALQVIAAAGLQPGDVDFIGSHGQTVRHLPAGSPGSSLQLGDPAVIAVKTGITTVGDFRIADMAAGTRDRDGRRMLPPRASEGLVPAHLVHDRAARYLQLMPQLLYALQVGRAPLSSRKLTSCCTATQFTAGCC